MAKHLLFEIGMEEIPARFIRGAVEQLAQKTAEWLEQSRVAHNGIVPYATPRRIAVLVKDAAEKQADMNEEVKGPSRKIAQDEQGSWTKAALGFARSQGVEPEALFFKELSGVDYVHAAKSSVGIETKDILAEGLKSILHSLTFPKNMRWGSHELKFVRPIRWLVALFGSDEIALEVAGVSSGRTTRGHRFLGSEVVLEDAGSYTDELSKQFVIADIEERKNNIVSQLNELAARKNWNISIKDDLLEEVLFLVEYPTVLFGEFDPAFLDIPQDVLVTSMREHQRYFPVLDQNGRLLPYFVTVRNGNDVSLDQVAKGNEKVLRARLSDARFFYQEDQKMSIDSALARLETIVFHEELGTIGDKVRRIRKIADKIAERLSLKGETLDHIHRAAAICKFDLVTQMVYEFPELQGIMGEDYAAKAGESAEVARAVFEHYQPRFSGDQAPSSIVGAVVSMADKMDTLVGCFSIGIIPTGSQDPYALRRQTAGIVQIMLEHKLSLTVSELIGIAADVLQSSRTLKKDREEIEKDLLDFFALRIKNAFPEDIRYDVVDAVMSSGYDRVLSVVRRGKALMEALNSGDLKAAADAFVRVNNLAQKAESGRSFDPSHLAEPAEKQLFDSWNRVHERYLAELSSYREEAALSMLRELKDAINSFFDSVMVMVDDDKVRETRLGLLRTVSEDIRQFADFQKIVW